MATITTTGPTRPAHAAPALPDDPSARLAKLIAGFDGTIQRPRISPGYRLALLGVAVTMVILPLIYVALAVGAAWATWQGVVGIANSGVKGRAMAFGVIAVAVIGGIVVVFMFKPLFAPKPKEAEPDTLDPADEPVLHGFVEHLCGVVGAPVPRRIDVDCNVNASASFRRGLVSFLGKDLKLTIGLPLVAGLNLRQFTGVLAHEFGHFSQGAGMRLTYVIRTVNHWFARVVYERDAWDQALVEWSSGGDGRVMIVVATARGAVWLTRRVLWVLMMIGHAVSCLALRQMEYDADAYETQVAGSDVFATTSVRLPELGFGSQAAHNQLAELWSDRRLCENMPALIIARVGAFEPDTMQKIREHTLNQKTGSLDTHPADADRIAAARKIGATGVFRVDAPATALFADFDSLCHTVTERYYRDMIGVMAESARLESVETLMSGSEVERDAAITLREVFGPAFMPVRPAWPDAPAVGPLDDADGTIADVSTLITSMNDRAQLAADSAKRFDKEDDRIIAVEEKVGVEEAGMGTGSGAFRLRPRSEMGKLGEKLTELEAARELAAADYDASLAEGAARIERSLTLLRHPAVAEAHADVLQRLIDADRRLAALAALRTQWPAITEVRQRLIKLNAALTKHNESPESNKRMVAPIKAASAALADHVHAIRDALDTPYPFDHAEADMTVGRFIVPKRAGGDDIGRVFQVAGGVLEAAFELVYRTTSHLCASARLAERVVLPDAPVNPLAAADATDKPPANAAG